MFKTKVNLKIIFIYTISLIIIGTNYSKAASKISFIHGSFGRTVSINDIKTYTETGKANGALKTVVKFTNNTEKFSNFINENVELPLVVTSKLLNSKIGEVVIERVAKIIHPNKVFNPKVTVPAIRAAVINGLVEGNGKINLYLFLKNYPNKIIVIDIPALSKIIDKAESINDLIDFFSEAPLQGLKEGASKE